MSNLEYFKLQAKNLMRDWNTHQGDDERGYVYTPRFFDIDGLLIAFDEDETKFCLQRAQHLIAQLVGFKKWDELVHASEEELRLAKTVFEGCKASDNLSAASDEWESYYYDNDIDQLDIRNQIYAAQQYFSLPVDEEFKKESLMQVRLNQLAARFKQLSEYAEQIVQSLAPVINRITVLTDSSKSIPEETKTPIRQSLDLVKRQYGEMGQAMTSDYFETESEVRIANIRKLDNTIPEIYKGYEKKVIGCFNNYVKTLIPEVINGFDALKQSIGPESEIVSLLRDEFDVIIHTENEILSQLMRILNHSSANT